MNQEILCLGSKMLYGVCNTKINDYPYPHFSVESIFTEEYYTLLEESWPLHDEMKSMADSVWTPNSYRERMYFDVLDERMMTQLGEKKRLVWQTFADMICSEYVLNGLAWICHPYRHLHPLLENGDNFDLKPYVILNTDHNDYHIAPHTQAPEEILVLLIYFSKKENTEGAGTSIYIPNNPKYECDGYVHRDSFDDFHELLTVPYRRNSLFGFVKTRNSFHGVDRIDQPITRNSIYIGLGLERS